MLKRALDSVRNQTDRDLIWILVNDGGASETVDDVARQAEAAGVTTRVLHHESSRGMEAASNRGLREASSRYVVIHDDDDSWDPRFLERTTTYLDSLPPDSTVKGVVTRSMRVIETIDDGRVTVTARRPHNPHLQWVTLFQMARLDSVPPPISILYQRSVLDEIGFYREDLPVLGDWEFNLRFLCRYDLALLPEALANYHVRNTLNNGPYGNSVIAGTDLHARYAMRLRNELLRRDIDEGRTGLGFVVNMAHELRRLEEQQRPLVKLSQAARKLRSLFRSVVRG